MQARLLLEAEHIDGDFSVYISANHTIELKPKNARAMAKRLLEMADWLESKGDQCVN